MQGFVSVQMVGVITWLVFYPPDTQVMYMYPLDEPPR